VVDSGTVTAPIPGKRIGVRAAAITSRARARWRGE
jgi:hypothetical protein